MAGLLVDSVRKLDFRFADEEDASDIVNLVNEAFTVEEVGKSSEPFAFRARPRLNIESLNKELETSQTTKWIVLETSSPNEDVVGAVALTLGNNGGVRSNKKEGVLRALAVQKSSQGMGIGNQLLRRAEAVCRGHGCQTVKMDIAMARDDIIDWLKRHGYQNVAGGAWMHDGVVDVTQYMSMVKDLTKPDTVQSQLPVSSENQNVISEFGELLELTKEFAESLGEEQEVIGNTTIDLGMSSDGGISTTSITLENEDREEGLDSLLESLMAQLKTQSGKQQFDDLVKAEDRNVLGVPITMEESS